MKLMLVDHEGVLHEVAETDGWDLSQFLHRSLFMAEVAQGIDRLRAQGVLAGPLRCEHGVLVNVPPPCPLCSGESPR